MASKTVGGGPLQRSSPAALRPPRTPAFRSSGRSGDPFSEPGLVRHETGALPRRPMMTAACVLPADG